MKRNVLLNLVLLVLMAASAARADTSVPLSPTIWEVFHPAWRPEAGYSGLRDLALDPDRRLEPDFRIPSPLTDRVLFWASVYSQFTSQMRLVHDRDDSSMVYGYIDFTPLSLNHTDLVKNAMDARRRIKLEREVVGNLSLALSEMAGNASISPLSVEDRAELKHFLMERQRFSPAGIRPLVDNIRTQSGQSDIFETAIERSEPLLPQMEEIFKNAGLPRSLSRLPFVESSFNWKARSKVGALGLWQFLPRIARAMIARRDRKQWSDPVRQTQAAAVLLSKLRGSFPDWGTTVTSYNSGWGRVRRLVNQFGVTNVAQLLDIPEEEGGLGFAGKNFFAELLAANLVATYKSEIFPPRLLASDSLNGRLKDAGFYPGNSCRFPSPPFLAKDNSPVLADSQIIRGNIGQEAVETSTWINAKINDSSSWLGNAFRTLKNKGLAE